MKSESAFDHKQSDKHEIIVPSALKHDYLNPGYISN